MAQDAHVEGTQERLREDAGSHAGGGLTSRGPLEDVAGVVEAVLLHPGEVGVAGPGLGETPLRLARRRGHLLFPLPPLRVADHDRHRRALCAAVADAAQDLELVLLDGHTGAAPEAEAPPGELGPEHLDGDRDPGGETLDDDGERRPVGLAGGEEAQHRRKDREVSPEPWGREARSVRSGPVYIHAHGPRERVPARRPPQGREGGPPQRLGALPGRRPRRARPPLPGRGDGAPPPADRGSVRSRERNRGRRSGSVGGLGPGRVPTVGATQGPWPPHATRDSLTRGPTRPHALRLVL